MNEKNKLPTTRILVMNELGYSVCVMAMYASETKLFTITIMEDTLPNQTLIGSKTIRSGYNFSIQCQPTDHYLIISKLNNVFIPDCQIHTIQAGPDKGLRANCFIMNRLTN